jgi:hypothetical protein
MPTLVRLAEEIARRLSPDDPSIIAQFRDRLPHNEIDRGAIILLRSRVLWELASRELGIATNTAPNPVRPEVRERLLRRLLRHQSEDEKLVAVFPSNRKTRERSKQQRPEDEKIAIEAKIQELWKEVRDGKWKVSGRDRETGQRVELSAEDLPSRPSRLSILADQLRHRHTMFEDVMLERVHEHVDEPADEALAPGADVPAAEAPAAVQDGQDLVDEWYGCGWVPACLEAGFCPSRDHDDKKAARQVFGNRRFRGMRDILRHARKKHAPEGWDTGGPKALDRKNARSNHEYLKRLDRVTERSRELWQERRGS